MSDALPDVALSELPTTLAPLDWVGMQGVDLPILIEEPGQSYPVHARVDVQVDLPDPRVKGIHMSRLYRLLDALAERESVTPASLRRLLQDMVHSHADCHSTRARVRLNFDLLSRRPALVTSGLNGWKSYPVRLDASRDRDSFILEATVTVMYSSTCPCSAALARQLIEEAFLERFGNEAAVAPGDIVAWLRKNGTLATPHSQRSLAEISIRIPGDADSFKLFPLIELVEHALATPVQTAVKRADEQAFARLNGQNLMYVEDAARRIQSTVQSKFENVRISVRHLESLHPHDAVAYASEDGVFLW